MSPELHTVELRQLPVRIWAQAQEHTDALLREFALIVGGESQSHHTVPHKLLALMERLDVQFAGSSATQEAALRNAADEGKLVLDLTYALPAEVVDAAQSLDDMLDEADVFCSEGAHLLTLASSPEVVRFRKWFLAQFVDQVGGRPPVAWPDWP